MQQESLLRIVASCLALLTALAMAMTLSVGRAVFVPFALALFAAFAAEPAVRLMRRARIPRWLAALVVVGTLYVAVQAAFTMIANTVDEFQTRLPIYLASLQSLFDSLPLPEDTVTMVRLEDPAFWGEILPVGALLGSVGSWATALTTFAANTLLVLMLMVALIVGRRRVDLRIDRAAGSATGSQEQAARVIEAIDSGIQRYMLLKSLLSLGVGLTMWLVLVLFGVDFAVLWGVLAFLLNFIPTVGPILATAPVVGIIFLQFGDRLGYALFATVCTAVVPFVFGNIIEPKVFGDSLNLNFFAVLFALVLWTFLWGVAGAVLSVPIMMAISVICREVAALRPIHELLRA